MLQHPEPDDYVVGTGVSHSVRDFLEKAFAVAAVEHWQSYIDIDPRYFRPTEVENLVADPRKANEKLGWKAKTNFDTLVKIMVDADIEKVQGSGKVSKAFGA